MPEANAVVVDESTFENVPVTEAVHGVAASGNLRIGIALVKAVQGIEREYDENVQIEVYNADKVLTEEEHAELQTLPAVERELVMLYVLGYRDEVSNALTEMQLTLSPETQALIVEILQRISAMTEEEYAEFMELLTEYFNKEDDRSELTLVIDGTRFERYSFQEMENVWIFIQLAVTQI